MQSTTSTNLSCNFNVLLPLAPAESTDQWPCSVHPCAGSACRVEIDRQTRSRRRCDSKQIVWQTSQPPGGQYLHLNACWWIHLPQVPTTRRRRPSTVGSQGVRASQDFLPMYSNGSFSSASRIPGTPCGYQNRRFVFTTSSSAIYHKIHSTSQTARSLAPSHSSVQTDFA